MKSLEVDILQSLPSFLLGKVPRRIYLIGVAGSGMSGIASILLSLGHIVSGSDKSDTQELDHLKKQGLQLEAPNAINLLHNADLVIYSSAVHSGNYAYDLAMMLAKPMVRRAQVLAAIMTAKHGVVVCGMHGKTTTSAMAVHVLREGGLNPSHYIGAEIPILGTNARWDPKSSYLIAEADESDGTLIHYYPQHALVLNIEPEHLDHYPNLNAIDAVFTRMLQQTLGNVYYWRDDVGATRVCEAHERAVSVGTQQECHYSLDHLEQEGFMTRFIVFRGRERLGEICLEIPGAHNAYNALLVIALASDLGVSFQTISKALSAFRGAKRRFECKYKDAQYCIFDDYAHHPTEIIATIASAKNALKAKGRLLVLFQPHRYTRTAALHEQFSKSFADADFVFVTPIYSAGEAPIPGVDSTSCIVHPAQLGGHKGVFGVDTVTDAAYSVAQVLREGDFILTLGAGNIHEASSLLTRELSLRAKLYAAMGDGIIRLHEPLYKHTTMRVGGPARFWAEPDTEEGFANLIKVCYEEEIPLMVIGRGSNLIIRDGGFFGVVVHLSRGCFLKITIDENQITAGVGVKLKQLAATARNAGLTGFEWMDGIPGNLGGALRMNAGAMGVQTFDQVTMIRLVDRLGNIVLRSSAEIDARYRDVPLLHNHYALASTLVGNPASVNQIDRLLSESLHHRKKTQPIAASAGCIFKNPIGISAGRLIDEMGLKNASVGGARVSEMHANFIVNDGTATAKDILSLIQLIQDKAYSARKIKLETEVRIIGEEALPL